MLLTRVVEGLAWRYRVASRTRYLRQNFRNHQELVTSFRNKSPCDSAVRLDGTVLRHPTGTHGLAQMILEICFDQVYTGAFYKPKPGDVIVDGGANIGLFSLEISRLEPNCCVIAFEPFEENFLLLKANLEAAGAHGVEARCAALSGASGMSGIVRVGGRSQDHQLSNVNGSDAPAQSQIPTYSFEDVIKLVGMRQIALFKCDIEGSEADLFSNAKAEHLRFVNRFAVEWHEKVRPGTLDILRKRLTETHHITVTSEDSEKRYGMLYAELKDAAK